MAAEIETAPPTDAADVYFNSNTVQMLSMSLAMFVGAFVSGYLPVVTNPSKER